MYMLDTNMCIYAMKNHSNRLIGRFENTENITISTIVLAELHYGIENSNPSRINENQTLLDAFLTLVSVTPWCEKSAYYYGKIRYDLKNTGQIIGSNDLLIAAHAMATSSILVTNNEKEFKRIPYLTLENWV